MSRNIALIGLVLLLAFPGPKVFSKPLSGRGNVKIGNGRSTYLIDDGSKYLQDDIQSVASLSQTKVQWIDVTLPYTGNQYDAVDQAPGYRRSAGWYKRGIIITANAGAHRFILSFEGVNLKSNIFVNHQLAGEDVGGYVGFEIDITSFQKRGSKNEILVYLNNSYDEIRILKEVI